MSIPWLKEFKGSPTSPWWACNIKDSSMGMNYWIFMTFKIPSKTEILWFCGLLPAPKEEAGRKVLKGERKTNQFGYLQEILERDRWATNVGSISKTKDWGLKHSASSHLPRLLNVLFSVVVL